MYLDNMIVTHSLSDVLRYASAHLTLQAIQEELDIAPDTVRDYAEDTIPAPKGEVQ